jgi:hypothetical protein
MIFTPIYLAVVIPGRWFLRHRDNGGVLGRGETCRPRTSRSQLALPPPRGHTLTNFEHERQWRRTCAQARC